MKRGVRLALIIGLPVLALGGIAIWAWLKWFDFPRAASSLDKLVGEAKQLGLPWEAKDLAPKRAVPASQNAAIELQAACRLYSSIPQANALVSAAVSDAKNHDFGKVRAGLQKFRKCLDKTESACLKPQYYIQRDLDLGMDLALPEFAIYKNLTKLLRCRAEMRASQRDRQGCLRDVAAIGSLARYCASEKNVIGLLVGIAIERIRLKCIENLVWICKDDALLIQGLNTELTTHPTLLNLKESLLGEYYFGVTYFRNFETFGGFSSLQQVASGEELNRKIDPRTLRRTGLPTKITERGYLAWHLEFWTEFYRFAQDESNESALIEKLVQLSLREEKKGGLSYMLSQILHPIYPAIGDASVGMRATQNCTLALLAVMQYREKHSKFPESLAVLGSKWIDPFTGKPLQYKVGSKGCRIYSVGKDREDNGGVARSEIPSSERGSGPFDEVVSYPPIDAM